MTPGSIAGMMKGMKDPTKQTSSGEKSEGAPAFPAYAPSYDEKELEAFIEKGSKAWADVPDSVAWVRELRGGDDA